MVRHHHTHLIHKKKRKDLFDTLVYFFTVATPLFELPQAIAIYSSKSAEHVSVYTWAFFLVADVVWLGYAFRHKIKPLMVMYVFYLVVETSIVAGILLYS
ncbi:MAG: PQ-loop domain-containing transporter [Candidatus Saccharimonadales bacterium]